MSNVHLLKSMVSPSNSSCQRYVSAGSALLDEAISALLDDVVSTLLEEPASELLEGRTAVLLEDCFATLLKDSAELSMAPSLELEWRFTLEAGMTEEDDSATLEELVSKESAELGDASSEHAAKQTIDAAHPKAKMCERNFLNSQTIKPNLPLLNYFASGSSGWIRAMTPTVARVALTRSAGATFNWRPRSPALT